MRRIHLRMDIRLLLDQREADLEGVVAVCKRGDGRDLGVPLTRDGGALLEEAQELVGREEHLETAADGLERAGHAEIFQLAAEGQGHGLFAGTDLVGAVERKAHDVAGEGLVGGVEGEGRDTGLDAELGEGLVDFVLDIGGHGRAGEVGQEYMSL